MYCKPVGVVIVLLMVIPFAKYRGENKKGQ
jgi:hypothetical protein